MIVKEGIDKTDPPALTSVHELAFKMCHVTFCNGAKPSNTFHVYFLVSSSSSSSSRWFFGYAFMFFVCSSIWEITAFLYLRTVAFSWPVAAVAMCFVPFWCMSVMLTSFHVQLTLTNMTTNEQMNFARYDYLQGTNGNTFDKGMLNNFIHRFFPPEKDSTLEEIERLLSGDIQLV